MTPMLHPQKETTIDASHYASIRPPVAQSPTTARSARRCLMTWYPLQAALKMSTLPGAIRATLDTLLDHINADPQDPTRPDTLTVWESRERLADETGFSEVTIRDHLQRLQGQKELHKGPRVKHLRKGQKV